MQVLPEVVRMQLHLLAVVQCIPMPPTLLEHVVFRLHPATTTHTCTRNKSLSSTVVASLGPATVGSRGMGGPVLGGGGRGVHSPIRLVEFWVLLMRQTLSFVVVTCGIMPLEGPDNLEEGPLPFGLVLRHNLLASCRVVCGGR